MVWQRDQRAEQLGEHERPIVDEWLQQPLPCGAVGTEPRRSLVHAAVQHTRSTAIERVSEWNFWIAPPQPVRAEPIECERRGRHAKGMDRRADIVDEARQRELGGTCAATDLGSRFQDQHRATGFGQAYRSGKPIGPRAHNDRIESFRRHFGRPEWPAAGVEPRTT